jgi:hypothetical protein
MFKNTIGDATLVSTLGNNVSTFFQILHHWTDVTFVVQILYSILKVGLNTNYGQSHSICVQLEEVCHSL